MKRKKILKEWINNKYILLLGILYLLSNINYITKFDINDTSILWNNIYLIIFTISSYFIGITFKNNKYFLKNIIYLYIIFMILFIFEIKNAIFIKYYRMFNDGNSLLITQLYNFVVIYIYYELKKRRIYWSTLFLIINLILSFLIGSKGIVLASIIGLVLTLYLNCKKKIFIFSTFLFSYIVAFLFRYSILDFLKNSNYILGMWRYKEFFLLLTKKIFFINNLNSVIDIGRREIFNNWIKEYDLKYFLGNPYYYDINTGNYVHQGLVDIIFRFGIITGILFLILNIYIINLFIIESLKNKKNFEVTLSVIFLIQSFFSSSIIFLNFFWFTVGIIIKKRRRRVKC